MPLVPNGGVTQVFKHIKFAELPVTDQDRAIKFYTDKVGLNIANDAEFQPGWRWVEMEIPGAETRILLSQRPDENERPSPSLILVTDDVQKGYEKLKGNGVTFTQEPSEAPWNPGGKFALFRDSENNTIMLG